ncbi:hypothetical protein GRJ2_000700400 [Grus japonensis]|uniref:Uncharacterized protein n=1 Tax=Grus japonensis TaxID=30415 RepID=A0ABC9W9X6_GRUJA
MNFRMVPPQKIYETASVRDGCFQIIGITTTNITPGSRSPVVIMERLKKIQRKKKDQSLYNTASKGRLNRIVNMQLAAGVEVKAENVNCQIAPLKDT